MTSNVIHLDALCSGLQFDRNCPRQFLGAGFNTSSLRRIGHLSVSQGKRSN